MARNYSNTAVATALASGITNSTTTISVGTNAGYPSPPYTIVVDRDTPSEEVCEVTAVAGTTWTITRGVDGTPATSHSSGAAVVHGVSARDFREPNDHPDDTTDVHGIASTASLVTLAGAQTLTNKTLTSPAINGGTWNSATIGSPSITTPNVTGGTATNTTLVTPTIASFVNATHTHTSAATGGAISTGVFLGGKNAPSNWNIPSTSMTDVPNATLTFTIPNPAPTGATGIAVNWFNRALYQTGERFQQRILLNGSEVSYHQVDKTQTNTGFYPVSYVVPLPAPGTHTIKIQACLWDSSYAVLFHGYSLHAVIV